MRNYAALIADMKKSRRYGERDREYVQLLVSESLAYLNLLFRGGLVKDVMFSAGDEVQGLFSDPAAAFLYFRSLCLLTGADAFRGGVGVGSWDVRVDVSESTNQDGEAYHFARSAIREAERNRRYDLVFVTSDRKNDELTTLADHSLGITKMRTLAQNELALAVELLYPLEDQGAHGAASARQLLYRRESLLRLLAENPSRKQSRSDLIERLLSFDAKDGDGVWEPMRLDRRSERAAYSIAENDLVGVSYAISRMSGMARQGLDRLLAQGRVAQERNAAVFFAYAATRLFGR